MPEYAYKARDSREALVQGRSMFGRGTHEVSGEFLFRQPAHHLLGTSRHHVALVHQARSRLRDHPVILHGLRRLFVHHGVGIFRYGRRSGCRRIAACGGQQHDQSKGNSAQGRAADTTHQFSSRGNEKGVDELVSSA